MPELPQHINFTFLLTGGASCDKGCDSKEDLNAHLRCCTSRLNDNQLTSEENIVCNICGKYFCLQNFLQAHINESHCACSFCGITFKDTYALDEHLKIHNSAELKSAIQVFRCEKCEKVFSTEELLNEHDIEHDKDDKRKPRYNCRICTRFFCSARALLSHEVTEHGAEGGQTCHYCGKHFALDDKLKRHIDTVHLKILAHQCELCPKAFPDKYALRIHLDSIHFQKREHKCFYCPKRFNLKKEMRRHCDQMHFEYKRFYCELCDLDFETFEKMVGHYERKHGRSKECKCKSCNLIFPNKQMLIHHGNLRHSSRARCNFCGRFGRTPEQLANHIKRVHEANPKSGFDCHICGKHYKSRNGIRSHRASHAKDGPNSVVMNTEHENENSYYSFLPGERTTKESSASIYYSTIYGEDLEDNI